MAQKKKPDYAHIKTDEMISDLEKKIAKVYKQAADDMQSTIDKYFARFKDKDKEKRQQVLDGKITEQEYKNWRINKMTRGDRYKAMRDKYAERMTRANEVAIAYVNDSTPSIYSLNRNFAVYVIETKTGQMDFTLFNERVVKRLIIEEPNLMPYYPKDKAVKRGIDLAYGKRKITENVTSGILQGLAIDKIAKNLQRDIPNMNFASARRSARTAATGAQNAGRIDSYLAAEKMGIKLKKEWLATIDSHTRDSHKRLDGEAVDNDKEFSNGCMYPGDPNGRPEEVMNCRCTLIANLDDVDTSDALRRVRDPFTGKNIVISDMTFAQWENTKRGEGYYYQDKKRK